MINQGIGVGPGNAARSTNSTSSTEFIRNQDIFGRIIVLLLPLPYCRRNLFIYIYIFGL